jgi:iron complex transport system permease protein
MKPRKGKKTDRIEPTAANIILADDEENIFASAVDKGHRIDKRAQKIFILVVIVLAVYIIGLILPEGLFFKMTIQARGGGGGSNEYTFSLFLLEMQENIQAIIATITGNASELPAGKTVGALDITRFIVVIFAGAGLAVSGAVYQGTFRNALVAPSTLGVMTGAQVGLVVFIFLFVDNSLSQHPDMPWWFDYPVFPDMMTSFDATGGSTDRYISDHGFSRFGATLWHYYGNALFAFVGCLVVVGLVLLTMKLAKRKQTSGIFLIIAGQVIAGLLSSFMGLALYFYQVTSPETPRLEGLIKLQAASFWRQVGWLDILAIFIPLVITFFVVMRLRHRMQLLAFSEGESRSMGVDVKRMRIIVIGLTTLLTAIIISFCGVIGYVGFLVPHLARRLVGPNFKYLLPASLVLGGVFLLSAFVLVNTLLGSQYTEMTGIFVSIGGAAVFLFTALKGGGRSYGNFK